MNKTALALILLLAALSLTVVSSISGQTLKPAVTEFSLQYVDNSYDVPPSYKYTKDLYTGETITTTIPGYRFENKTIVATIKNPPEVDAYNFRWKPHNDSRWYYQPFDTEADQTPPLSASGWSGPPAYASDSEYTVISVISLNYLSVASMDIQVMALYGDYRAVHYTHVQPGIGETYDFYFDGQASYWSDTQTIIIGEATNSNTPNPTSPTTSIAPTTSTPTVTPIAPDANGESTNLITLPLEVFVFIVAVVGLLAVALSVLLFRRHQKTVSMSK